MTALEISTVTTHEISNRQTHMDIWEAAVKKEVPLPEIQSDENHLFSGKEPH